MFVRAGLLATLGLAGGWPAPAALAQDSSAAPPIIVEAHRLADARQLDPAAALLRGHLEREPADREARSLLARVLSWNRRFDESIAEYRQLLADDPGRVTDRAGYARVLLWSGRTEASLEELRRVVAEDSTDLESHVTYARALSWTGDLPGASMEYRRILARHPDHGDAWLGYATVARWRSGATASDRFLRQAEAHGAAIPAATEERAAVRSALAPALGAGWSGARERQYVAGPDFTLRTSGPYTNARITIGRAADVTLRAAWMDQYERAESGALTYDVNVRSIRADVALLRGYPFQASGGVEARRYSPGAGGVTHPLLGAGDFVGWSARTWAFLGRLTPALAVRRDFVPLKATSPVSEFQLGHQTVAEGSLAWQWSGRGSAETVVERGDYSDGNARIAARAGTRYRVRIRQPAVSLHYGFGYTDFDSVSASYFTPLASTRHTAGIGLDGYTSRHGLSYGAGYEFSTIGSDNFGAIRTSTWSARVNAAELGPIGIGVEGAYSRDNNAYEVWSIGIQAAARW